MQAAGGYGQQYTQASRQQPITVKPQTAFTPESMTMTNRASMRDLYSLSSVNQDDYERIHLHNAAYSQRHCKQREADSRNQYSATATHLYEQGVNGSGYTTLTTIPPSLLTSQGNNRLKACQSEVTKYKQEHSEPPQYFGRTIVESLLLNHANHEEEEDIMNRIQIQNNILDGLQEIPDYEKHYLVPHEELEDIKSKRNSDIFHRMVPNYRLEEMFLMQHYQLVQKQSTISVYSLASKDRSLKLVMDVPHPRQKVLAALIDPANYHLWNSEVDFGNVKLRIYSENTVMAYQKHRAFGKYSEEMDFSYIRHLFQKSGIIYMVDKAIQHSSFPLLDYIKRGNIKLGLWAFDKTGTLSTRVTHLLHLNTLEGSNSPQPLIRYMGSMGKLSAYLQQKGRIATRVSDYFDVNWGLKATSQSKELDSSYKQTILQPEQNAKGKQHQTRFVSEIHPQLHNITSNLSMSNSKPTDQLRFQNVSASSKACPFPRYDTNQRQLSQGESTRLTSNNQPDFQIPISRQLTKKIEWNSWQMGIKEQRNEGSDQIREKPQYILKEMPITFDRSGRVLLPIDYLKVKHAMAPGRSEKKLLKIPSWKDCLLKDIWKVLPTGDLICIKVEVIKLHNGVIGQVLKKVAKHLLSGQSLINISFPISIFSDSSALELLANNLRFAPLFLQAAAKEAKSIQRFKLVVAFMHAYSTLFLGIDKPFNPILGETFQGWIDGCPVYVEQISHHPPISAILMYGRGYRISFTLEPKIELEMNRVIMTSDGEHTIEFERFPQNKIRFRMMGGEISGIIFGERKFCFVRKAYFYDEEGNFLDLEFNPYKKGMFSFGKQSHPSDWFEGTIVKTSPAFVKKFRSNKKKEGPSKGEIAQVIATVNGQVTQSTRINGVEYYKVEKSYPFVLEHEPYPLNSNCNYREDVAYFRKKDLDRAQAEKQRLEILQRHDQRLRQKAR